MAKKRYKADEIVTKLKIVRGIEKLGHGSRNAIRQIGVSVVTYYCRRKEYFGMACYLLNLLKGIEKQNQRLHKVVSYLALDKLILKEAISENY